MKILAIGSHPDDIEYGCGGTLLIAKRKKYEINLLVVTQGQAGGAWALRKKEQERAAKKLNAKLIWGGMQDTKVELNRELIQLLEKSISEVNPDIIFVTSPQDTHQDHRNVATAVISAARHIKNVLFYEEPSSIHFQPCVYVNITKVIREKAKLLRLHKSQECNTSVKGLNIVESAEACSIYRGFQDRVKYAEGFLPLHLEMSEFKW